MSSYNIFIRLSRKNRSQVESAELLKAEAVLKSNGGEVIGGSFGEGVDLKRPKQTVADIAGRIEGISKDDVRALIARALPDLDVEIIENLRS